MTETPQPAPQPPTSPGDRLARARASLKDLLRQLGPGFITGAADDDPSGIATYAQTGAIFGYGQLWLVWFTLPFMVVIQQMCGRIGMVTGKGLAGVIREHYPRPVLWVAVALLVVANTINIGADLGAMAASAQMLLGLPFGLWLVLMTGTVVALEVFVPYRLYARILKYLGLTLLAYVLAAFVVRVDWPAVAAGLLVPSVLVTPAYLLNVVAVLGTTISPYLFFWQASEEVEEEVADGKLPDIGAGRPCVRRAGVAEMNRDTTVGMLFSQVVMFFIIVTSAATLHAAGATTIGTAAEAAEALRPLAGDLAYVLFAAGIIGTGLLAVPVLAGASAYAVAETTGIEEGLSKPPGRARGFYAVIAISTLLGMSIDWVGIDEIRALYYAAALNGLAAPPLMALIVLLASRRDVMGRFVSSRLGTALGWIIVAVMALAGAALIAGLVLAA
jgi:NRAMP (natural resistance-associated macrophage protein)-like metal ion transporter